MSMLFNRWRRASLKTRVTLFTLVLLLLSIWSLTLYADHMLRQDIQRMMGNQQLTTVTLMATEISDELNGRLHAIERVAGQIHPDMLARPADLQRKLEDLVVFQDLFNGGIYITGQDGVAIASVPKSQGMTGVSYASRDYIATPLKTGQSTVGQPVIGHRLQVPVLGMGVPIRAANGQVVGVLAGGFNLQQTNFMDRLEQATRDTAGNYYLVATQARTIVASSEKHRVMEVLPTAEANPKLDLFLRGHEGTEVLVNPRGVEVLASVRHIPIAGWYAAVSLPTAQAFAPMRRMERNILGASLLLSLLAGSLTWWLVRQQLAPLQSTAQSLAKLANPSQPLHPLPQQRNDEIGQVIGGFNRLLNELERRQTDLRNSEALYRTAFRTSPDALTITRVSDGHYLDVNDGFTHLFGWNRDEVIGNTSVKIGIWADIEDRRAMMRALQQDGHCEQFETQFLRKDGQRLTALVSTNAIVLNGMPCILAVTHDISARKAAQDQIQHLAFSDPLTGLPNRRLFLDRLRQALASSGRHSQFGALLFVDLDDFKSLNDTLGHDQGDLLLQTMARRITACVRDEDTVARLGGDEFVVLLEHLAANADDAARLAETVGQKILSALKQPCQLGDVEHQGSASIGISVFSDQHSHWAELLQQADLAMYQAKATGRSNLLMFDPQMQARISERVALVNRLRTALDKQQFQLHYQPQVAGNGCISGAEALVRWQDPEHGTVSPGKFIPLAEETGLILPLGRWVLETACAQLAAWASQPALAHLTLAVNVSASQFHQDDFAQQVLDCLERSGAPPQRLKLELTESLLVTNVEAIIGKMNHLKACGVGFSLDDFGTGYSSLSYLKRLPLDQLKIDQGFVRDILTDPNDLAIAKMVIALSQSLGLAVIAEGVETEMQRATLAELGCPSYQGYLFSPALPLGDFELLMANQTTPAGADASH